jgi:hypothetical protein
VPIWTYGIPLWGTASNSNTEILQIYKKYSPPTNSKCSVLYSVSSKVLHADLKVPTVREEITKFSVKYRDKITTYLNELASKPLEEEEPRRLKRFKLTDLTTRFS